MNRFFLFALFTVLTYAGSVQAASEVWLETANIAGGKIILLQQKCSKGEGKMVIASNPGGKNLHGCWYYFADMIHVVYEDGSTYSYELTTFTARERK